MQFEILSRENAIKYSKQSHDETSVIISINDLDETNYIDFNMGKKNNIKGVLYLTFADNERIRITDFMDEEHRKNSERVNATTIQDTDGKKIVEFVNKWKDKVDKIIVHCSAGISRSSGVCAAISLVLTGSDLWVFENPMYCPNMTCYRTVLNAFNYEQDKKVEKEKELLNITNWTNNFWKRYN